MKKKYLIFMLILSISLFSDENKLCNIIQIESFEPENLDARFFYNPYNFSDEEGDEYIYQKNDYFSKLIKINSKDIEIINFLEGTWELNIIDKDLKRYKDYMSAYNSIGFIHDPYYGYAFDFFGSGGTKTLYKNQDYLVSTVGTMGWIGPILRYEFQNEKMYLYILNMDKWELADFHEGGKNYFIKTNPTHTPLTP